MGTGVFLGKSPIHGAIRLGEVERKDITLDFKAMGAIEEGDGIRSAAWTYEPGTDLMLYGAQHDGDRYASVWVTGAKRGVAYRLSCTVETTVGRTVVESVAVCGQLHKSPDPAQTP